MDACGDYYATLRVSPDADAAALRRAYRALMRQYHPDVNKDAEAPARCHAINEAYECLRDASKRADYDAMRRVGERHARHEARYQAHAARASAPLHDFVPRYSMRVGDEPGRRGRWRKVATIALGAAATLATFTATARVDLSSVAARPDAPAITQEIVMKPKVQRPAPPPR